MNTIRINNQIRARELRVIDDEKGNIGVIPFEEAMAMAKSQGLDLIEVSAKTNPPIAKIADYGKFQYDLKKKAKEIKAKAHTTETKSVQVKIGTGDHDLEMKAKKISGWIKEGHRVKIDLYLQGRAKYSAEDFKKERLSRILTLITEDYKIAEDFKKIPKGLMVTLEKDNKKKKAVETKEEHENK